MKLLRSVVWGVLCTAAVFVLITVNRPVVKIVSDYRVIKPGEKVYQTLVCPNDMIGLSGSCKLEASVLYTEYPETNFIPSPGSLSCITSNPKTETDRHLAVAYLVCIGNIKELALSIAVGDDHEQDTSR